MTDRGLLLLVDLDGVVYRGSAPVPGVAAVIADRAGRGDDVVYVNDELVHLECEDTPKPAERTEEVCPACWLIKPCDCGAF